MNRDEIRLNTAGHSFLSTSEQVLNALASMLLWLVLFALITCPVWLPGLVEAGFSR